MHKAIGFAAGQAGDLIMQTVTAKQYKLLYPDSHLTFAIGNKFSYLKDLFLYNKYIDDVHIWDSYDNWPTQNDISYINLNKYNHIFNAMPKHTRHDWYRFFHSSQEYTQMQGLGCPDLNNCHCYLKKYFNTDSYFSNHVALSLFPNGENRQINMSFAQEIVDFLCKSGYKVIQLGGKYDKDLIGASKPDMTFFEAIKVLLSCKLHISADTSFAWASSAYSHPMIGLYGINYPDMSINDIWSHNPLNANAIYLNQPFEISKMQDITPIKNIINFF